MLVLSRYEEDKVVFPSLGISVQILRVQGNKVRLGIDAPHHVKVLRHELAETEHGDFAESHCSQLARQKEHLNAAALALFHLKDLSGRNLGKEAGNLILSIFRHLKKIDEQLSAEIQQGNDAKKSQEIAKNSPVALLVEDNVNESRLLASYLRTKNYDVSVARDGREALDYLEHGQSPDVVLLDMQMPGMDGATAIQHIRTDQRHSSLRVFAVSGGAPSEYGIDIGPKGVDGWFPKPLDPEALVFRLAFDTDLPGLGKPASASKFRA